MPRLSLPRVTVMTLVPFMIVLGASFNTIIYPQLMILSLGMYAAGLAIWGISRYREGWDWYPTALDGVIWLWVAAVIVAGLANPDGIRRSLPSAWFVTALIVGWYVLHDMLSNGAITRAQVFDMLLLAGSLSMAYAIVELVNPDSLSDGFFGLPRVGGLTGNPNLLSALLVPIIGAAFGRAWGARGALRAVMLVYGTIAVALLGLTYSRGGWLGGGAAIGVLALAFVAEQGWMTPAGAQAAWKRAKTWQRTAAAAVVVGVLGGGLLVGLVLIDSLDDRGRSADLRTYLWLAAWDGFTEKPLTGNGLYSTPRIILDRSSVPPRTAQPHAHNFPLQVLSEMGILGGAAIAASLFAVFRWGVRAWRGAQTLRERQLIAGGWAASVGFGVHNLFDLAAWTPYVALCGFLVLLAMTAPAVPAPMPARRARLAAGAAGAVALATVLTGLYSYTNFARYETILQLGRTPGQMLTAAAELDALIAIDPGQPVYRWTQGMLYAVSAETTQDAALAQRALARFTEAGELGMDSAVLRLNLAALSAELGDSEAARVHLERALAYAPESTELVLNAALAAERWGLDDTARMLWTHLLAMPGIERSGIALAPGVSESAIGAGLGVPAPQEQNEAVALLASGQAAEALALLDAHPEWRTTSAHALRAIARYRLGQDATAAMNAARNVQLGLADREWVVYAESVLAGEPTPLFAAPSDPASLDVSDEAASGILARLHFMRQIYGRILVPQAGYDGRNTAIAALAAGDPGERD